MVTATKDLEVFGQVTNDAEELIQFEFPYIAQVRIKGTAPLLFHAWSVEGVEKKGAAAKGSKAKKTDDVETFIYRDQQRYLCLPGEYLRMSVINAAKFRQDPRSPRKSAMDLYKAGVVSLTEIGRLNGGVREWDYLDRRRAVVQRNGITRSRPAFNIGWFAEIQLMVNLPEYIRPMELLDVVNLAGRLIGVGDFRPTYGRYAVDSYELMPQ